MNELGAAYLRSQIRTLTEERDRLRAACRAAINLLSDDRFLKAEQVLVNALNEGAEP